MPPWEVGLIGFWFVLSPSNLRRYDRRLFVFKFSYVKDEVG